MSQSSVDSVTIEVVYASPSEQKLLELSVPRGTTAAQAVELSGIVQLFPEIESAPLDLGIFSLPLDGKGRPLPHEYVVEEDDRVEIYRPLTIDPMQARLARAEEKRVAREAARDSKKAARQHARNNNPKA
ncbi:MAG: RnfH family protein [Gammaproteobacteria bacterium]|jgi:uncharacterized protein|nr:RnfH family protein [Gammaproteobacteria bacterium]